eukprot:5775278-Lingulodinium_polyedra.AAC.1
MRTTTALPKGHWREQGGTPCGLARGPQGGPPTTNALPKGRWMERGRAPCDLAQGPQGAL